MNRSGSRCTKNIKVEADTWYDIESAYKTACRMSWKPDITKFPIVRDGDVIDEEKSVRWNREEVIRLRAAYGEEVKRLNRERNAAIAKVTNRAIRMIAEELCVSEDKAKILWSFVYDKYHAYGEMFDYIDEYIDLIKAIKD